MNFVGEVIYNRICFLVLLLSAVVQFGKTDIYPSDFNSRTYFERFEDLGTINRVLKHSEYTKVMSHLQNLLQHEPLLGIDTVLADQSYTNIFLEARSLFLRERRSVDDSNVMKELIETNSSVIDFNSSRSAPTNTDKTSHYSIPVTTSEQFLNVTDVLSSVGTSSSQSLLSSASFPVTREQIATTSPLIESTQCVKDMQRIFESISAGDQWSLQFLDSWGKPGPGLLSAQLKFVGNYKECRSSKAPQNNGTQSAEFSGNYCSVGLASAASNMDTVFNALVSSAVEIGTCMSSSCSTQEIFDLFTQGLKTANLSSTFTVRSVDCRTDEREYTAATIVSIILLSLIASLMILGTAFDVLFVQSPKWAVTRKTKDIPTAESSMNYQPIKSNEDNVEARFLQEDEKHVLTKGAGDYSDVKNGADVPAYSENMSLLGKGNIHKQKKGSVCMGILIKVLMSFSAFTNGKKLLNTSQPQGSLGAIHGIRFISMSWVILGHMFSFSPTSFLNLATSMPEILSRWTFDAISNALVSVDTFFSLSGLLVAYLTTKELQKKEGKINWAMYYFHRFWRLTPPYMLVLVIALGLHRFLGSGALWSSKQPMDKTNCEDNWWTNLLYINNFVNTRQMCMTHSWYLANDMQFYILSPLMIVPFYFNSYAGIGSCLVFLIASWTTIGVLSTKNSWPNSLLNGAIVQAGTQDYQHYYYYAPYCRIGPFVIGIIAGYLLAITKGNINMKWYYVVIGWVVAISVALASVYGIHGDITGENVSSVGLSAFYNAVARSAWGACICWVIVACACGYGGPVNAILSWSPFVFLGRLTYMAYLIHPTIIMAYFENMDQLFYLNDTNFVISYLGILVFTNMASFVLVLGLESPMIGLEKVFLQ